MSLESVPTEKLIVGIHKAFDNAKSFLNEAYILKEYEQWAHSYSLCQLAIEEFSKIAILIFLWINRINEVDIDYQKLDMDFTNHKEKTKLSTNISVFLFKMYKDETGNKEMDEEIIKGEEIIKNLKLTNDLKNESLYVTIKDNDFQAPIDIITKNVCEDLYNTASLRKITFKIIIKLSQNNINKIAKLAKGNDDLSKDDN